MYLNRGRHLRARRSGDGREDVDVPRHVGARRSRRDLRRPAHEEGGADAALEEGRLPPAIGCVEVRDAGVPGAAIVAGEDDEGVVVDPRRLQLGHHVADPPVELRDHRAIDARLAVLDLGEFRIILTRRLKRRVRRVEGEIKEEGPVLVRVDRLFGFGGEIVGHMPLGMKALAAVESHGMAQIGPDETVDRIPRQLGVDRIGIVVGQEFRAPRQNREAFVKTLRIGLQARRFAQMPFADVDGVISRRLHRFGNGNLARRDAHVGIVGNIVGDQFLVEYRLQRTKAAAMRQILGKGGRHRGKFETEARRIAAGHHRRARRRTGGVRGIGSGEVQPLTCQRGDP